MDRIGAAKCRENQLGGLMSKSSLVAACSVALAVNRGPAVTKYLEAGFGLTDLYCQRFFVIAAQSDRKRQFERNSGSTVDALMNAVLGLSGAGQTALGLSNAAFEAYDSTYQNIQDAFLVSPDIANVRKLVQAAQLDFKTRTLKAMPTSYEDGRSTIERYAGICSYTGMKQLVNDSVTSQTQELTNSANPPSSAPKDATNNGGGKSGGKPGQASQQPQTPPPPSPTAQVPLANASKE
uniref:hypothetical protein n=1 Tax=Altererythrobacter segetis TaxID=1104773 RepID=UPI00140CBEE9|nr:hypothetical protein [Altererythrobacter segetis]